MIVYMYKICWFHLEDCSPNSHQAGLLGRGPKESSPVGLVEGRFKKINYTILPGDLFPSKMDNSSDSDSR